MRLKIYDILKARYLVNEDAIRNWRFIVFLIVLAMIMIANSHSYERKILEIAELNREVKELRSEFVDRRSELMKLKMESTISRKMELRGVYPSQVPPAKIKVIREKRGLLDNLWQ